MKNSPLGIIIILLFVIGLPVLALAGPGGPPATPIDGGLSLLLALGGGYAVKKLKGKN